MRDTAWPRISHLALPPVYVHWGARTRVSSGLVLFCIDNQQLLFGVRDDDVHGQRVRATRPRHLPPNAIMAHALPSHQYPVTSSLGDVAPHMNGPSSGGCGGGCADEATLSIGTGTVIDFS